MPAERSPAPAEATARVCDGCGSQLAPTLLVCPACQRLVHAVRLKALAATAQQSEAIGDIPAALAAWNQAIPLLPAETRQHAAIAARIGELGRAIENSPLLSTATSRPSPVSAQTDPAAKRWSVGSISGAAGSLALVVWKAKFLVVLFLTKAKFLLLGLTKASTFLSMLASFGLYWTVFGGWFALGFVVSIYIHEMGHVAMLRRYGIHAGAPLFLPGLGAVILLKQSFSDPRQDARVGLAGPIWGLGAALGCAAMYAATQAPIWAALTQTGALINLFNLIPVWQLDGGRAFHSLTRRERWIAVAVIATTWALTEHGLLFLLLLLAAGRTVASQPSKQPDSRALWQYNALVVALAVLMQFPELVGAKMPR